MLWVTSGRRVVRQLNTQKDKQLIQTAVIKHWVGLELGDHHRSGSSKEHLLPRGSAPNTLLRPTLLSEHNTVLQTRHQRRLLPNVPACLGLLAAGQSTCKLAS